MSYVDPDEMKEKMAKEEAEAKRLADAVNKSKGANTTAKNTAVETPVEEKPPEKTLFDYLERIATAIEDNTKALLQFVDAKEKIAFDVKVEEVKTAVETKAATAEKKAEVTKPKVKDVAISKATGSAGVYQAKFSPELQALLTFENKEDFVIIKTKKFLESDNFAKVAKLVRELGGEYISAGENTHFKIKKTA